MPPYQITSASLVVVRPSYEPATYEITRHLEDLTISILFCSDGGLQASHFVQHVGTGWVVLPRDPAILAHLEEHGTPWHHRDGSVRGPAKPLVMLDLTDKSDRQ